MCHSKVSDNLCKITKCMRDVGKGGGGKFMRKEGTGVWGAEDKE